jgi:hypothetical protein
LGVRPGWKTRSYCSPGTSFCTSQCESLQLP